MFIIKKQAIVLGKKMEKQASLLIRRQQHKRRKSQVRKDQVITEYIHVKYPTNFQEAEGFYESIVSKYPNKNDLRKTDSFKALKSTAIAESTSSLETDSDNMIKKPLINHQPNEPERTAETFDQPNEPEITAETFDQTSPEITEEMTEEIRTVEAIQPTLDDELSSELNGKIIKELRAEPELQNTFTATEEKFFHEELDIDIDIPEDILEKELWKW